MAFRDHPVFADDAEQDDDGPGAVILGFADRVVRQRGRAELPSGDLPVADISLRRTAARLARLEADGWVTVQHPAMGPDHLVIGGGGAFAVTTTRLVGKVLVAGEILLHNGHCTDYLRRVRTDAQRVSARLGRTVHPVLVIDSEELAVREEPVGVGITSSHRLRTWLQRRPARWTAGDVERAATAARNSRTWR